jgi:hypothetical protein
VPAAPAPSAPAAPSHDERPAPAPPVAAEPVAPPPRPAEPPASGRIELTDDDDEAPAPVLTRVPDISAVLRFLASLKDEDIQLMARRALEFVRNRFPAAEGKPGTDGFTFTLEGKHVVTVIIAKKHIELEVGPDRLATGRIRDLDGLHHALSLPSVVKGFDALRS